jgi:hypothetical protein
MTTEKGAHSVGLGGFKVVGIDFGSDVDRSDGVAACDDLLGGPKAGWGLPRGIGVLDAAMVDLKKHWRWLTSRVGHEEYEMKGEGLASERESDGDALEGGSTVHGARIGFHHFKGKALRTRR